MTRSSRSTARKAFRPRCAPFLPSIGSAGIQLSDAWSLHSEGSRRTMRWNGRGELVCPLRGQSLESRLAAQRSVVRAWWSRRHGRDRLLLGQCEAASIAEWAGAEWRSNVHSRRWGGRAVSLRHRVSSSACWWRGSQPRSNIHAQSPDRFSNVGQCWSPRTMVARR
jgi:hypothetical protein